MKNVTVAMLGAVLGVSACGPDPLVGPWSYTGTNVVTVTMPAIAAGTQSANLSGTLTITSTGSGFTYVFSDTASGDSCTLTGTRSGSVVTFAANQACTFTSSSNTLTATITSGTATVSTGSPPTQVIHATYTFISSVSGVAVTGNGTEDITATQAPSD